MVFARPTPPPGAVLTAVGLPSGTRVLASSQVKDLTAKGSEPATVWLLATMRGVGIVHGEPNGGYGGRHLDWVELDRAEFKAIAPAEPGAKPRDGRLTLHPTDGSVEIVLHLPNAAKRIASIINERLTASVVAVEKGKVPAGQVRVALRRDHHDQLSFQVSADVGVSADDAATRDLVDQLAQRLREAAGLPPDTW